MSVTVQKDIRERLEKLSNLPSMPQVIVKIKQISENPKSSVAELANVILCDHQLTSRILRMANSSYYGEFSGKINTVTHAIVLMGFRTVRNIAISMAIYGMVNRLSRKSKFDISGFWTRSLATGVVAKFLAHRINQPELIEAAFIAGFMHDIGEIILAGVFPDKYNEISSMDSTELGIHKREKIVLGIDHLEAGGHVAAKWQLPDGLVKAITDHHRIGMLPTQASENILTDLVYLGDRLVPHLMSNVDTNADSYRAIMAEAKALIGAPETAMLDLPDICREQVQEIAKELRIDIQRKFDKGPLIEDVTDLQRQLEAKEIQLAFLQNATDALLDSQSVEQILQVVCESVLRGFQLGRVILFEHETKSSSFKGQVGFGVLSQRLIQNLKFSAREGLFHHIRDLKEPVSVVDANSNMYDDLQPIDPENTLEAEAFAAIPMLVMGSVRYVLFVDMHDRSFPIPDAHIRSMLAISKQGSLSLERLIYQMKAKR